MAPAVFDDYLHWVYRGVTVVRDRGDRSDDNFSNHMWAYLVALWIAGDQLGDTALRNAAINSMRATEKDFGRGPYYDEVNKAWERTPPLSTLRRLIMDIYVILLNNKYLHTQWDSSNQEFLKEHPQRTFEITRATIKGVKVDVSSPHQRSACHYHEHKEGGPACGPTDA